MKSVEAIQPRLARVLSRRDLIVYGLVILTPTAPYPVYGMIQQTSGGHATLCYLVAMVAMLFTAASYARMSVAFPMAGSTYTYVQRGIGPEAGFIAGWAMMLDYFLIPLLSVVYAALTMARLFPQVPYLAWVLLFTVAITCVNLRGIRYTMRANTVLITILSTAAVLFAVLAIRTIVDTRGWSALWSPESIFNPGTFSLRTLMLGAGISALSYIGFDAVTTLAEDAREPGRDMGFATITVCLAQTGICVVTVYLASIVWPDFRTFPEAETAILDLGRRIGGQAFFLWLTFVLLVAGLASAMTGQAGASRLLLGMGRDGVIPRKLFGTIDAVHNSPTRGILFMAAITLLGSLLAQFQLIVELLNFGAFAGFILVNLSVIGHYFFREKQKAIWKNLIAPALGALVCAYLWLSLSPNAKFAGAIWMSLGIVYLAFLTRGFRVAPREMTL